MIVARKRDAAATADCDAKAAGVILMLITCALAPAAAAPGASKPPMGYSNCENSSGTAPRLESLDAMLELINIFEPWQ
eukprot:SAG11_NODE_551_length_8587_cov_6.916951_7_plen_78_part_00